MTRKMILLLPLMSSILITGCQNQTSNKNNPRQENLSTIEDKSKEITNDLQNFVTDGSNIIDGSQIIVNTSLRNLTDRNIKMTVEGRTFVIQLYDNKTADDLWVKLPLHIKANNYSGWEEKICRLNSKLSMDNAPQGDCPLIPEVGYYEPGNWIALYYGEIGYWSGKVPLGKINATSQELKSITDGASIVFEKTN